PALSGSTLRQDAGGIPSPVRQSRPSPDDRRIFAPVFVQLSGGRPYPPSHSERKNRRDFAPTGRSRILQLPAFSASPDSADCRLPRSHPRGARATRAGLGTVAFLVLRRNGILCAPTPK